MDIAAIKLDLVERLLSIRDKALLIRLREVIDTEVMEEDISDDEVAELEQLRSERLQGKGASYSWEDVQRMAQAMIGK